MRAWLFGMAVAAGGCRGVPIHRLLRADDARTIANRIIEGDGKEAVRVDCGTGLIVIAAPGATCQVSDARASWRILVRDDGKRLSWSPADSAAVEHDLRSRGERSIGPLATLRCDDTFVAPGAKVHCAVEYAGGAASAVDVAIEPDGTTFTRFERPIANLDRVAADISKQASAQLHQEIAFDCGTGIVATTDGSFLCTAAAAGDRRTFRVTSGVDGKLAFVALAADGK